MSAFMLAGPLGVILFFVAIAVGAALGDRAITLWCAQRNVNEVAKAEDISMPTFIAQVGELDQLLSRHKTFIEVLVVVAPLLGLLGTVTGMIDTFGAMTDAEVYERSGGVAAGVSQALITTELGLIVAAPGVLLSRLLSKRADGLRSILLTAVQVKRRFLAEHVDLSNDWEPQS